MNQYDTILLACADPEDRRHLRYVLNERFNILEASNVHQTTLLVRQNAGCVAAVVMSTDVAEGAAELEETELRRVKEQLPEQLPVIVIVREESAQLLNTYFQGGAADVIGLHYDAYAMLHRIESISQLYEHQKNLEAVVRRQAEILCHSSDSMVDVLSAIIESRSMESAQHILRIRKFTQVLMEEVLRCCPEYELNERRVAIIASAAALHDIGKISIPDSVLLHPAPLDASQWEIMKTHTTIGWQLLGNMSGLADPQYLQYARDICLYHHERWDGGGYPMGLTGDQIPICAQVVGLADAFEALISRRVYKEPHTFPQAVNMIVSGECGAFSPQLLECFKNVTSAFRELARQYPDGQVDVSAPQIPALPDPPRLPEIGAVEQTRAMYLSLVHYLNAFLVEVNLERELFHVVYNPYPELAQLDGISTLGQLIDLMLDKIVVPQEREQMRELIFRVIPRFLQEGLRRSTHYFHYQAQGTEPGGVFEMTLLQIGGNTRRETVSVLLRKLSGETAVAPLPGSTREEMEQIRAQWEDMRDRFDRYRRILTQTENLLFEWDMKADQIRFSDTWSKMFKNPPPKEHVSAWLSEDSPIHPDDLPGLLDAVGSLQAGAEYATVGVRIISERGRYIWCRFRASAYRQNGELTRILGVMTNVDDEKRQERTLKDQAERDGLTKLLNKNAGRRRAERYLSHYPQGVSCALLIIDLDNFKQVNDHFGHLFGDAVLTKVARQIQEHFRGQDIICRIGGDEFLVLYRGIANRDQLEARCRQLLRSLSRILEDPRQPVISCSIGIALSPEHGTGYYQLFNNADRALYQAKAQGKNDLCFFDPERSDFLQGVDTVVGSRIDSDEEPSLTQENLTQHIFHLLYTAQDPAAAIREVLALLGSRLKVSRVYIFENSPDDLHCSNTFEWCDDDIKPEQDRLQNLSYGKDIPDYMELFDEQGIFYCPDISQLPQKLYDIAAVQNIKSMLQCAIRQEGRFRGFVGFDECESTRLWTKEDIGTLSYFSEILSVFLTKYREQELLRRQTLELQGILDNQDTLIYVIDPDTHAIRYLNRLARELMPDVQLGDRCYSCIQGKSAPCPGCASSGIREKGAVRKLIPDDVSGEMLLSEATLIRWAGSDACIMTLRPIPGLRADQIPVEE